MKLRLATTALALAAPFSADAPSASQNLELAADIRTVPNPPPVDFLSRPLVEVDGALLFMADDGVHGLELWRTDGTAEGTWMVRDICPGSCGSRPLWTIEESRSGDGSLVFFAAEDGVHGTEPWVTDGTPAGTRLLADLRPGIADSRPEWFRWSGEEMLFTADDGVHGVELWAASADGSAASLVADIRPGTAGSSPNSLVGGGGRMFLVADDGVHGSEPWISEGTAGGTELVADLDPGASGAASTSQSFPRNPRHVAFHEGRWYFQVSDPGSGLYELWSTDGSAAGTARVVDAGGDPVHPDFEVVSAGDLVYFKFRQSSERDLWGTDGTGPGTYRVADLDPAGNDFVNGLTPLGERLFFRASRADIGFEPWVTDGTAPATVPLADVHPGAAGSVLAAFRESVVGNRVFFYANDGLHGEEPWSSDGTAEGTRAVADVRPGSESSGVQFVGLPYFAGTGPHVVFFAFGPGVTGLEPWVTTAEGEGAELLADLDQQASSAARVLSETATEMVGLDGHAFVRALADVGQSRLWRTAGDPEAAAAVLAEPSPEPDLYGVFGLRSLPASGAMIALERIVSDGEELRRLVRSDGTAEGTFYLSPITTFDIYFATPSHLAFVNGGGLQLTDGSTAWPLSPLDTVAQIAELEGAILLQATSGATHGLWRSDAPFTNATLVAPHLADPGFHPPPPAVSGGRLFYVAYDAANGRELWMSDGTAGGTGLVRDIAPGPASAIDIQAGVSPVFGHVFSQQLRVLALGDDVLFVADEGNHGQELWRSDGTEQGTALVADLRAGAMGSEPLWLTPSGGFAYFVANDGVHGRELWRTDGTAPGTVLFDLLPGAASSAPTWLLDVDGVLYFVCTSTAYGVELWRLEAGALAPELVADLNPGTGSSSPASSTLSGRRLFVIANDGVTGYEPRSLVVPTRLPAGELSHAFDDGELVLTLVLQNPPALPLPDDQGHEVVLELPAELTPLEVSATAGSAAFDGQTLTWNGSMPAGGTVEIVTRLDLSGAPPAASWSLQGEVALDTTADGVKDFEVLTDDPAKPGSADPTVVVPPGSSWLFGDGFESGSFSAWSRSTP